MKKVLKNISRVFFILLLIVSKFASCNTIEGGEGTGFDIYHIDKSYARIDGGLSNPGYFTDIADKPVQP